MKEEQNVKEYGWYKKNPHHYFEIKKDTEQCEKGEKYKYFCICLYTHKNTLKDISKINNSDFCGV